ncbi:MAG: hypothetical protein GY899_06090, partial [Verrucomicrobiaceae bacterium]|nr:hypothetical protein [Verrucomicrobiaceae bacterium]
MKLRSIHAAFATFVALAFTLFINPNDASAESKWGAIPESVMPAIPADSASWGFKIWYSARNGANQEVNDLGQTMAFLRDIDAGTSQWQSAYY